MTVKKNADDIKQLNQRIAELEKELTVAQKTNPKAKAGFNWRSPVVVLSILISGLLFTTGAMAFAFNRTINDPQAYIKSIGPVIQQPAVQKAIVQRTEEAINQNVNIEQIVQDALPEKAAFLAQPITNQVNAQINNILTKVVSSDRFYQRWIKINTKLHDSTLSFIKQSNGDPSIDVNEIYTFLSGELKDTPLSILANKELPAKVGVIKVGDAKWVPAAHSTLAGLPWIQNVGLLLGAVFAGLAIYLAKNRRRASMWLALWISAILGLSLVAISAGDSYAFNGINDATYKAAAVAIYSTVLAPFYAYISMLLTVGIVVALMSWANGKSSWAIGLRKGLASGAKATHKFVFRGHDNHPVFDEISKYRNGIYWLITVATVLILILAFRPLYVSTVLVATAIALVLSAIVEIIAAKK